jgi:protein-S-isoprenylcysteine O-methyltransferase Ste14
MQISPIRAMTGRDLQRLQHKRKQVLIVGILAGLVLLAVTDSTWRIGWPRAHRGIQWSGLLLILICILGRTWATLYIGGLKQRELVTKGPYSVVRNPLYLFTLFGAAGIGALSGSLVMAIVYAGFASVVFLSVVLQEEQFLLATFPHEFPAYAARVPRLVPRLSTWQDADQLIVKPRLVHRTFLDASLFLMAVPLVGLKALVRDFLWLPIMLHLP